MQNGGAILRGKATRHVVTPVWAIGFRMRWLKGAHRRAWQDSHSFPENRTAFSIMNACKRIFLSMALCFASGAHSLSPPGLTTCCDAAERDPVAARVERGEARWSSGAGDDVKAWPLLARRDAFIEKSPGQDLTQLKKSPDSRACRTLLTRVRHSERYAREANTVKSKRFHEAEAKAWQKKYDAECAP